MAWHEEDHPLWRDCDPIVLVLINRQTYLLVSLHHLPCRGAHTHSIPIWPRFHLTLGINPYIRASRPSLPRRLAIDLPRLYRNSGKMRKSKGRTTSPASVLNPSTQRLSTQVLAAAVTDTMLVKAWRGTFKMRNIIWRGPLNAR